MFEIISGFFFLGVHPYIVTAVLILPIVLIVLALVQFFIPEGSVWFPFMMITAMFVALFWGAGVLGTMNATTHTCNTVTIEDVLYDPDGVEIVIDITKETCILNEEFKEFKGLTTSNTSTKLEMK